MDKAKTSAGALSILTCHCRQTLDPATRLTDLDAGDYGHITWANEPESALTTLDDVLDMGYAGPSITIREVMNTMAGPFCYFYL